jgi:hypothetical protein
MPRYTIEAVAYDKDGRRLNGNVHTIDAEFQRDAERNAESRQKFQAGTARVETRVLRVDPSR